jgi:hypothetical protein
MFLREKDVTARAKTKGQKKQFEMISSTSYLINAAGDTHNNMPP